MLHLNPKKAGSFQDIPPKILKSNIIVRSEKNNDTVVHCEFPNELKRLMLLQFLKKMIQQKL